MRCQVGSYSRPKRSNSFECTKPFTLANTADVYNIMWPHYLLINHRVHLKLQLRFSPKIHCCMSVEGLASRLRAGRSGFESRQGQGFSFLSKLLNRLWGPPSLLFNCHWGSFPEIKQWGSDFDYAVSSSTEVKNDWSYTSSPLYAFMAWTGITLPVYVWNFSFMCLWSI
jgi:hypothetical protein